MREAKDERGEVEGEEKKDKVDGGKKWKGRDEQKRKGAAMCGAG